MKKLYTTIKAILSHKNYSNFFIISMLLISTVYSSYGQVKVPFSPRTSAAVTGSPDMYTIKGDFTMMGNTNLTLVDYGEGKDNNQNMKYVDVDNDPNTFNSSSATLTFSTENGAIPSCSKIIYAGLYWTGRAGGDEVFDVTKGSVTKTFNKRKVLINGPNTGPGNDYIEITAHTVTDINEPNKDIFIPKSGKQADMYAAYADITSYVQDNGLGEYFVADVATLEGDGGDIGYYGGWGMVVVYENPKMKWKDITVFDGYAYVASNGGDRFIDISGFKAAQSGAVNIKLGLMAGEGDRTVNGDRFRVLRQDGTYQQLSHSGNTTDNFFNSSITTGGNARNPELLHNTGVDIAMFDIDNTGNAIIANGTPGQTQSTQFMYNSTRDTYIIFNLTFAVDGSYVPESEGLLTLTSINGNPPPSGATLNPGDNASYKIEMKNLGTEAIDNTTVTIPLTEAVEPNNFNFNYNPSTLPAPTYNPSIGTHGAIIWNVGTLPISDPNTVLADLSFTLNVTTDCTILAGNDFDPNVVVNGSISGAGAASETPFTTPLIQGYETIGCIGSPITEPMTIPINHTTYINEGPVITALSPININTCSGDENDITVANARYVYNASQSSDIKGAYITSGYTASDNGTIESITYIDVITSNTNGTTVTRTFTATDDCGNDTDAIQIINISDSTNPTAICQDITVQLDANGNATITANQIDNNSSDNCGIASISASKTTFDCSNMGENTVTLTVTDNSGNEATCDAKVTVEDNVNPTAICQDITVQLDANGNATITANQIDNNSSDNCGIASISASKTTFDCSNVGENTVTLTVTDNSGNEATCDAKVTVEDNVDPTAICQDITVQLDANGNATITANQIDNNSSDNCGIASISASKTTFDCSNVGENTVTLTVTDNSGNEATCDAKVTVEDNVDPTAICQDITVQLDANGNATITANQIDNNSSDNCGIASISASKTTFDCSNLGENTVTLTVTDNSGNEATCDAKVTVEDNVNPTAICKDTTVQLDANGNATITANQIDNNSSDNCGIASISASKTTFDCSNLGENTVTLTVTDNSGNEATCDAKVTVEDNVDPTAICQDITVQLDANGNATITANQIDNNSSDNCGIASISASKTTFDCSNLGENTVTLTVTDNSGNEATCDAKVTVEDNVDPTAICQDITVQLDANGNATITANQIDNNSSDNCGIASISASKTTFDCSNLGENTVTLTVTDNSGNEATCDAKVTVEDNVNPTAICKDTTVQLDANGNATITANQIDNNSSDNCGIASISASKTTFDCSNLGENTVTLTVTDNSGNEATCDAKVTVEDNVNPTAICKDTTVQLDANGNATITANQIDNNSSDNCGIASISASKTTFDCSNLGENTVTLTVTDNSGNEATCDAKVTVEDNVDPTAICQDITVQLDANGNATITANQIDNNSSDNCGIASISASKTTFDCSNLGENTVTLTVTDNSGNEATCDAKVTVEDNVDPTAICQDITVQLDANGNATITANQIDNNSSDNCGIASISASKTTFDCSNVGENTVTLTVTDNSGNEATCDAKVTVEDNVDPTAICQDITVQLDANGNATITANQIDNNSSDNCGIASISASKTTFDCSNLGENTVTLTVTDNSGNEATCDAKVTVEDNVDPTAICQDITVQLDANGNATITANQIDNNSSDNCGIASISASKTTFDCSNMGENTVTLTVTDNSGNEATCDAKVTVEDNVNPTAICQDITVQLDANGNATITANQIDNNSSDNCGIASISASKTTFDCSNLGENTVTLTVTDNSGNEATCDAKVTVEDNVDPTAICQDITVQLDANGNATITANQIDNNSSDNCGIASISASKTTFDCSNVGENTVTLTVTDNSGNEATCDAKVTVEDNVDPTAICQDITVQLDANGNATITANQIDNNSSDNCGIASISASKTTFDCSNLGENTVTLTVTDNSGNEATCDAKVTVEDNVNPTAICKDITVQLDANGNATITANQIDNNSSDNCGIASISASKTTFDCSNLGENTVTLTVTDNSGNEATCDAKVTVEDNVDPTAICQDITVQLDANGNATITANQIDNNSSDNCGIASISASKTTFDCSNLGENTVTLTVTDNSGNEATCDAKVTVEDNVNPTAICQDITVQLDANGNATITANQIDNNSSDNCGIASISASKTTFDCSNLGENTVTLTVTDNSGNEATCDAKVTVEDNVDPTAICQDITVQLDANGNATITANQIDNNSSDNCGIASISASKTTFDCSNLGENTVTLTVTDNSGNEATCDAKVTVEDNVNPTAICQDITVQLDANGNATITANQIDNNSSDNCGIASISASKTTFDCSNMGENTVTLTVTDNSGNEATCDAKVTVEDNVDPTAICQDITVQLDANGNATITANQIDNNSSDNCGIASISASKTTFDCSNLGENTVTLTVTDSNGNQATCDAKVTVEDNVDPTAICQDITVQLDANGNATITANQIDNNSSDNCGIASISASKTTFDCSNLGENTVTLTVTDNSGNEATCDAKVTVEDSITPTITCPKDVITTTSNDSTGNCTTTANIGTPTTADNCAVDTVVAQVNGTDIDPNTYAFGIGKTTVTWIVTDASGNTASCEQTVTVNDDEHPTIIEPLPNDITVECDAIPTAEIITATDNCGNANVDVNDVRTDGDCPSNYTIARTWTATDDSGLTTTHTQIITVQDTTAPTPTTNFATSLNVSCTDIPDATALEFTDNCTSNVTVVFNEVNTFDENALVDYEIVRTWTVRDECNNEAIYKQTLSVSLDEFITDVVAPDWCYDEGIINMNDFIDGTLNTNGTWELLEGDPTATLTDNLFDPTGLELSENFLPDDGGIDYTFRYTTIDNGCTNITEVTMNVHADCVVLPCGEKDVVISKAITPNGDAYNQSFEVNGIELCGFTYDVKIFNRWGALIFESNDYQNDWSGISSKGSVGTAGKVPNGTYYYIINIKNSGLPPFTGPVYIGTK